MGYVSLLVGLCLLVLLFGWFGILLLVMIGGVVVGGCLCLCFELVLVDSCLFLVLYWLLICFW